MIVTPHNISEPETIGLSVPCGGGNFSLIVGISFDEAPMKAAATPAAPLVHVPICSIANHTFSPAGLRQSSWTRNANATIRMPLAVNSRCAMTIPRNHATADGGIKPTTQPTVIWRTPRIRVQRRSFAFKLSRSVVMDLNCPESNGSVQPARTNRLLLTPDALECSVAAIGSGVLLRALTRRTDQVHTKMLPDANRQRSICPRITMPGRRRQEGTTGGNVENREELHGVSVCYPASCSIPPRTFRSQQARASAPQSFRWRN